MINTYNYKTNENYKNFENTNTIEKEIYSNIFYGFYESIFCYCNEFIDYETEDQEEFINKYPFLNENDIFINYNYPNFKEYENDIINEFSKLYLELINNLLPYEIIENENFLLELKTTYIDSPKYYNYRTDKIGFYFNTNYKTLQLIKDYVLNLENIENYIIKKCTSYDGFISFLSNDINYWTTQKIENYEINEISFIFDSLIILNNEYHTLNYEVFENVDKYEYVLPYVDIYNYSKYHKTYLLYDFEKMIKNYLKTIKSTYNVVYL